MYSCFLKRVIDFIIAFFVLAAIFPILLLLIIFLYFANNGAGVFFTQNRPGKNAKIFKAIKFKTMTDERDSEGNLLSDAERLTKVGKIVRSLSIDELPQLLNVLKGDMSLVGRGHCFLNTCLYIQKNSFVVMKSVQALRDGHR